MVKVVYNIGEGIFMLSSMAMEYLHSKMGVPSKDRIDYMFGKVDRWDEKLVNCVETLGDRVNTLDSDIKVKTLEGNKFIITGEGQREKVLEPKDIKWIEVKENDTY